MKNNSKGTENSRKSFLKMFFDGINALSSSERICLALCVYVLLSVVIYIFAGVPVIMTSDSANHVLLAEEIVYNKQLIPSDWNSRNDISIMGLHNIIAVLTLFMDDHVLMLCIAGLIVYALAVAVFIYCSKRVSVNNCWLLYIPLLLCGVSADFDSIMYGQFSYITPLLYMFLVITLFIDSLDENYRIRSKIKFILSLLMIVILGGQGIRYIQCIDLPLIGAIVILYIINHNGEKFSQTITSKPFRSDLLKTVLVISAVALGFVLFKYNSSVHNFLPSKDNSSFTRDFGGAIQNFYNYFIKLMGLEAGHSLFSIGGILNVIKLCGGIMLLVVFPFLQIRRFKTESASMRFFTVFSCLHVLEILLLSLFCNTLIATRYLYTSMFLLYYLSAHYITKYMLSKDLSLKNILVIMSCVVFVVPLTLPKTLSLVDANEKYAETCALVNHLEDKGLEYGYATTWNSTVNTIRSDFKVQINKAQLSPVMPIRSNNTDRAYYEETYQGRSFVLLGGDNERDTFLNSESYTLFGAAAEIDTFENFYIYIYDYNIANNDFGGLAGGFTGKEFNQLFTMKNDMNAESILKYTAAEGFELISSHTAYGLAEDDDLIMLVSAEALPQKIAADAEAAGQLDGYDIYTVPKSAVNALKNPNYIINSDFSNELGDEWQIGSGEKAERTDNGVTVTCVGSSGRAFYQQVAIHSDLVGKPVTLSISVKDYSGDVAIMVSDIASGEEYVKRNIDRDNYVFSFTFVPKSNGISISPAVPKNLNNYAEIEYVKLEAGGVPTAYTSETVQFVNENLIENSDFDKNESDAWTIGSGEKMEYSDMSVTVTCVESTNRLFQQVVMIEDELIGMPVTFSMNVVDHNGEVVIRICDSDNDDTVYVRQTVADEGVVSFTFIPEDNDICIQPAVPKNVGDHVTIEWVKLEEGSYATPYMDAA